MPNVELQQGRESKIWLSYLAAIELLSSQTYPTI
jgi:hypothetical protein